MRCAPAVLAMLALGGVSGCIPLFYAYPAVSYVPAVNVGRTREKTYAFRVDIADRKGSNKGLGVDTCIDRGQFLLRQIHVAKSGYVSGQAKVELDSGFYWNCFVKCFEDRTNHTVRLRFYRPGYQLVEVQAWQTQADLSWREAHEMEGKEKALDALLGPSERAGDPGKHWGLDRLAPGSASLDHHCALLFAASEYERIARHSLRDEGDEAYERCLVKAKWLRELAGR